MLPSVERFSHSFVTSSAILTSLFAAITVVTYGCGSIATAPESDEASIAAASEASDLNSIFTSFSASSPAFFKRYLSVYSGVVPFPVV